LQQLRELASGVVAGETNALAVTIAVAALLVILGCRRWMPEMFGMLITVAGATTAVTALEHGASGWRCSTTCHKGCRRHALNAWAALLGDAAAAALVSFTDISILSRTYEPRGAAAVERN
jgi:MFS superfamily sulfate permease-like transporter